MSKKTISNIFCKTYGHNYFRLSEANDNTPELICKTCKNYFKSEDSGLISPVTHQENQKFASLLYLKRTA